MAVLAVMWALVLVMLAALAIDGGLAISQHERAADLADEAARAEAQNLVPQDLRDGRGVVIAPDPNCSLARAYLTSAAASVHFGKATVEGCSYPTTTQSPPGAGQVSTDSVTVQVQLTYSPFVFDIFGGTITVNESGTAFAQSGD